MPSILPLFQLLPLASPRAKRGADVRRPPSASIQPLLHQDSNGTSTRWLIETVSGSRQNLVGISEQVGALEVQWPWPTGVWTRTNPTPSYGSNSMTEDGGEQPMWRLIGSSRIPRHMAAQLMSSRGPSSQSRVGLNVWNVNCRKSNVKKKKCRIPDRRQPLHRKWPIFWWVNYVYVN
jgi:hypothetical protein